MNGFKEAKNYGGIGSLLIFGGLILSLFIIALGLITCIIGLIFVLLAVKNISEKFKDKDTYKNYLIHVILVIGAFIAVIAIIFVTVGMSAFLPNELEELSKELEGNDDFENLTDEQYEDLMDTVMPIVGGCCISVVVGLILLIISGLFLKKSFDKIAEFTNIDLFKTTGIIFLIGAITSFILIGGFIILVAYLIQIISFFRLQEEDTEMSFNQKPNNYDENYKNQRRCSNCGRLIPEDAKICPYCGKDLQKFQ